MSRPTRNEVFMEIAEVISDRGTCSRAKVGAVIVVDKRIVSCGYNGAPPGVEHCDHRRNRKWMMSDGGDGPTGPYESDEPCTVSIHAELNAIAWAARSGVATIGGKIYCTHAPCLPCAQAIISAGINEVIYRRPYRDDRGLGLCTNYLEFGTNQI